MTDIQLTEKQKSGINAICDWYHHRTKDQQVFRVFGYAGVGKSTIVKHAIEELGIEKTPASTAAADAADDATREIHVDSDDESACVPPVLYGTFTGKAAHVLRKKGTPARTIHSLIYAVSEASETEIADMQHKIDTEERKLRDIRGPERYMIETLLKQMRIQLKEMRRPRFMLNDQSPIRDCNLVVVDEVSMVGPEMATDLLSFGKPILVLGDPGQLPPIKGEGFFTQPGVRPDVFLDEIHRQAAESPIIQLATRARQSQYIDFGRYSDDVWKMRQRDVTPDMLCSADQVVTGMNATRLMLNNAMRNSLGRSGLLPCGPEEKVICLKNDNEHGLINGMFISLGDIQRYDELRFSATIHDDEGNPVGGTKRNGEPRKFELYAGHFEDHDLMDPERHDRDWKHKKNLIEATFGYAITCHKAQGSGFGRVAVWNDGLGRTREDRARWLYTALTRAEEGLLICE